VSLTASARRIDDKLLHEVDVNNRHTIVTDEPVELGGGDVGPAPHELLPATLAACISTMISMYAQNKGWQLSGVRVDVEYDHQSVPRHFDVVVQLPDGLTPDQIERLRRVADSCPVRRAMEAGFSFDERITIGPDASVASIA